MELQLCSHGQHEQGIIGAVDKVMSVIIVPVIAVPGDEQRCKNSCWKVQCGVCVAEQATPTPIQRCSVCGTTCGHPILPEGCAQRPPG